MIARKLRLLLLILTWAEIEWSDAHILLALRRAEISSALFFLAEIFLVAEQNTRSDMHRWKCTISPRRSGTGAAFDNRNNHVWRPSRTSSSAPIPRSSGASWTCDSHELCALSRPIMITLTSLVVLVWSSMDIAWIERRLVTEATHDGLCLLLLSDDNASLWKALGWWR
jgi:hypothetical protein